jgi:chemotaxis protein MotB
MTDKPQNPETAAEKETPDLPVTRIVYRNPGKNVIDEIVEGDESHAWLMTYTDLMMLLLVFFILLYSMSSLKLERFKEAMASIQAALGNKDVVYVVKEVVREVRVTESPVSVEEASGLRPRQDRAMQEIQEIIQDQDIGQFVWVYKQGERIIIQIRGAILFPSSQARLNTTAGPVFDEVAKVFEKYPEYSINIKGHTDNRPINSAIYPSNWELSTARAASVLRWFVERGIDPHRMTASGYADYMPIASNDTPEDRARNRRVEFVLEKAL